MNRTQKIGVALLLALAASYVSTPVAAKKKPGGIKRYDICLTGDLEGGKDNAVDVGGYISGVTIDFIKPIQLDDGVDLTGYTTDNSWFFFKRGYRDLKINFMYFEGDEFVRWYSLCVINGDVSKTRGGALTITYDQDVAWIKDTDACNTLWEDALTFVITMTVVS